MFQLFATVVCFTPPVYACQAARSNMYRKFRRVSKQFQWITGRVSEKDRYITISYTVRLTTGATYHPLLSHRTQRKTVRQDHLRRLGHQQCLKGGKRIQRMSTRFRTQEGIFNLWTYALRSKM